MKAATTPGLGYPGRLTDQDWALIEPVLNEAKRKRRLDLRAVCEGLLYVLEQGCKWRSVPGPIKWQALYYYFRSWKKDGTLLRLQTHLLPLARKAKGRHALPSVAVVDTQSTKTRHGGTRRGYDAGKGVSGRKRLVMVDTLGLVLGALVQSASEHDSAHVATLFSLTRRCGMMEQLKVVYADLSFRNRGQKAAAAHGLEMRIESEPRARRSAQEMASGAKPHPKPEPKPGQKRNPRWIIERTLAWLGNFRRLSKEYEKTASSSATFITLAGICLSLNKI